MNIFKVAGIRRPFDSKAKIDMMLDFLNKNGIMLDWLIDLKIRESIFDVHILKYFENHNTYKILRKAGKQGLGIKIHLFMGHKKKGTGFPRHRKKTDSDQKKKRRIPDIFKKKGEVLKPRLSELVEQARASEGTKKPEQWVKIVYVPMGGQNKKY